MQSFKRGDLQKKDTFFSIEAEFVFAKISDNTIIDVGSRSMLYITLKLDFKIDGTLFILFIYRCFLF